MYGKVTSVLTVAGLICLATPVIAQPVTERSPNLNGTWISSPRVLHFQFAHRFQTAGGDVSDLFDDAKIVNYPTFEFDYGLFDGAMLGFRYSSNSLIAGTSNEWQPFLKAALLPNRGGSSPSVALTGAWNAASESFDGELAVQSNPGRFILLGAVRGFTNGWERPGTEGISAAALAAGVGVRLTRYLTLSADVAEVLDQPDFPTAWSASLGIGIPYTPHSLSIVATNVSSGTLQGQSVGLDGTVYWGFEFTVPFSGFARWGKVFDPIADPGPGSGEEGRRVVEIEIRGMKFSETKLEVPAGTTVRWVNRDPVVHTTTGDGERPGWGSPSLGPGDVFEVTFKASGEFTYHCVPHPFMTGKIVVR
jgi:plastocyanin